ncbi:uncharacterized protein LOC134182282 [Corticium candelabrum]|uniref:uncharacterized protein LOC134182282 n=1 Tax=Corticium candelabrum TaxID=121492 RepID=UPI002E25695E|nr:uncharacterized protein LOC134182282 [Corticium candelabrum]
MCQLTLAQCLHHQAVGQLGYYLLVAGHLDKSEKHLRESLALVRHSLHKKHPGTAIALKWLAECLMRKGKNIEAEKLLFEAVYVETVWLHENHPNKIYSQNLYEKLRMVIVARCCKMLPILVEYKRRDEVVEFYLTLKAVHKLSTAADLPNSHLPSHSPLSDEEQEASYFCSEEGLHSCGFTSSSTAQRDSTSSQRSILQQPGNVHTVSQCAVGPSYSKVQERSSLLVCLPVGSGVPYRGYTFWYIDTTGQTVEEVPGETLDSRTIETVTPAWPHADRVEIHIFSSDGQTRLGYFVHVFIDLSAKVLPDCEGDSSMLPGVVDQGREKEHPSVRPVCVAKMRRLSS